MRDGRRKNAPTSAGRVPWVLTDIIDAAASSEQRCHAVPPPPFGVVRGGFGQLRQHSFVRLSAPVPFACAEGVWHPGLIDELIYYLSPLRSRSP